MTAFRPGRLFTASLFYYLKPVSYTHLDVYKRQDGSYVVCNGELYGFSKEKAELEKEGYSFKSDSDCEIILPLYEKYGLDMFRRLDAEFAIIIYDAKTGKYIAARDPIGIRPLYYGKREGA